MSHSDSVACVPPGFHPLPRPKPRALPPWPTPSASSSAFSFTPRLFIPTPVNEFCENFVFDICGASRDWDVSQRVPLIEERIRTRVSNRNVFFFVSGGVDSTVAYTLSLRALGPDRVYGIYVDTGLMRKGETEFVRSIFRELGATHFLVDSAEEEFLAALDGVYDPEQKRCAIGEQFVKVQQRILDDRALSRRSLDSRARHNLSRHHRIGWNRQSRSHQDSP